MNIAGYRTFGMFPGCSPGPLAAMSPPNPYTAAAAASCTSQMLPPQVQRSPFAIHELLGLAGGHGHHQTTGDTASRAPPPPPLPFADFSTASSYIPRAPASPSEVSAAAVAAAAAAASHHHHHASLANAWRQNLMSSLAAGSHPHQSLLAFGPSPHHLLALRGAGSDQSSG